jgi:hypothetical protein
VADRAESVFMGGGCRYVAAGEAGEDLDHEAGEGLRHLCYLRQP